MPNDQPQPLTEEGVEKIAYDLLNLDGESAWGTLELMPRLIADWRRLKTENEKLHEILERIMTQHWDMAACPCWVCRVGRDAGLHPMSCYLNASTKDYPEVRVRERKDKDHD